MALLGAASLRPVLIVGVLLADAHARCKAGVASVLSCKKPRWPVGIMILSGHVASRYGSLRDSSRALSLPRVEEARLIVHGCVNRLLSHLERREVQASTHGLVGEGHNFNFVPLVINRSSPNLWAVHRDVW